MEFIENPPDAASLMTSARSFGNYDLAGALADLIDNSIKAKAKNIVIFCLFNDGTPEVRVIDDGSGMLCDELQRAMRPAASNPNDERSPDDLGRFGWGMKSASFSQCTCLTVISRQGGISSGASWDLNDLDNWKMGVLEQSEIVCLASDTLSDENGTEIIWTNCDRLSENGTVSSNEFNELISNTAEKLALIFHRFLSGEVPSAKLSINLNGIELEPYDPFYRKHDATQSLEVEPLRIQNSLVTVKPFILPHFSKLRSKEHEKLGGIDGFLRNQGFYVYRNNRLIIHGTWFGLAKFGELSQLVRISVDLPNSMDDIWKITVDKSDAQLPALLRNRLRQIVQGLKSKSTRVYRSKGGRIDDMRKVSVWRRFSKNNEIRYEINRDHPIIASVFAKTDNGTAQIAMRLIEQNFPVIPFSEDAAARSDSISQSLTRPDELISQLEIIAPGILADCKGDRTAMCKRLRIIEPFSSNWAFIEDHLKKEGWL